VKELAKDRSAGNAAITALVLGEFLSALSVQTANLFGSLLAGVDRLPHTHSLEHNAFSRKQPEWGAPLADELQRIVALHDASNIAAVIVEPGGWFNGGFDSAERLFRAAAGDLRQIRNSADF
jgi:adenosylmethionine-8-amino-7-oxononanoate aminotransferase